MHELIANWGQRHLDATPGSDRLHAAGQHAERAIARLGNYTELSCSNCHAASSERMGRIRDLRLSGANDGCFHSCRWIDTRARSKQSLSDLEQVASATSDCPVTARGMSLHFSHGSLLEDILI